jgi:hypothetical protein
MLTSVQCQKRADQKIAEAELEPRHKKSLPSAAQGWSALADMMRQLEASLAAARADDR